MTAPRQFEELRSKCDWVNTIAYWLGICRKKKVDAEWLLATATAMEFQYDMEEQADAYGSAIPEDEEWARRFKPVAPVQLALSWSPLPSAVSVVGEPAVEVHEIDNFSECYQVAMFWNHLQVADSTPPAPVGSADERRFLGLLAVAIERAKGMDSGLLLTAKPGWSYDESHSVSTETASIMRRHGFAVVDRRPMTNDQ